MDNQYDNGLSFLNRLYKDLHLSDEVMHTATPSDSKNQKVGKYLDRLERVEEKTSISENDIKLLKSLYYKKYVIKEENVPESYFELQERIALERGFGHVKTGDNERRELINTLVQDQKKSLDVWIDYFMSKDCPYPEWFKYYAFQGMIKLGSYDKKKGSFNKRTDSTTNVFVDLNREALSLVYDNLCSALEGQKVDDEILKGLLQGGNFSKLYSYMIQKVDSSNKDINSNDGIWIKYDRGSEPDELAKSLEGKGTGWCTAGIETARAQLNGGDFYVYYTKDSNGEYKQPRIAIRMEGDSIGEIRGIAKNQNIEPEMEEVVEKKIKSFPDADKYKKRVSDMKKLTELYNRYQNGNIDFTVEELRFLYEVDSVIEGFGYRDDPRIQEMLSKRNFKVDLAKVFNCSTDEISNNIHDIFGDKRIIYFVGNIRTDDISRSGFKEVILPKIVKGLVDIDKTELQDVNVVLPDEVGMGLSLKNFDTSKGLVLPNKVSGGLLLRGVTSAKNVIFPGYLDGDICLNDLVDGEGLVFPEKLVGSLHLNKLKSAKNMVLPRLVTNNLSIGGLENADGLILPDEVGGRLGLSIKDVTGLVLPKRVEKLVISEAKNLKGMVFPEKFFDMILDVETLEGVEFPDKIDGSLELCAKNLNGIKFPKEIGNSLMLFSLVSATDVVFPETIDNILYLGSLVEANNVTLPSTVGETLCIRSLISTDGLNVPSNFSVRYLDAKYITLEDLMAKAKETDVEIKPISRGFSQVGLLTFLTAVVSLGIMILGTFLTK